MRNHLSLPAHSPRPRAHASSGGGEAPLLFRHATSAHRQIRVSANAAPFSGPGGRRSSRASAGSQACDAAGTATSAAANPASHQSVSRAGPAGPVTLLAAAATWAPTGPDSPAASPPGATRRSASRPAALNRDQGDGTQGSGGHRKLIGGRRHRTGPGGPGCAPMTGRETGPARCAAPGSGSVRGTGSSADPDLFTAVNRGNKPIRDPFREQPSR
jgi:hypothetical protein